MSDEKRNEDEAKDGDKAAAPDKPEKAEAGSKGESDAAKAKDADADAEESEAGEDDGPDASPEAIARRVAALGEEDEIERIAREEERKLAERRSKKKGKKTGLEVAASKKLSKIGKRAEPKRSVAVAADADPLIEKTAKISEWARKNQKTVQLFGAVLAVALLGVAGFLWLQHKRETDASVLLAKAVDAQRARIGEPAKEDEEDHGPSYKTFDERRDAALKQYREVQSKFSGTGAAILSRLAEGSIFLDKREPDSAVTAFNEVKTSPLAAADQEVKGRALEGLGFAHELKAQTKPDEKDKALDDALRIYKELENTVDVKGFKEMAMYHQARVLMNKGDKEQAKTVLLSLKERIDKPEESTAPGVPAGPAFPYLKEMAMDRLREIDPESAPKQTGGVPGGGQQLNPAQLKKMMEEMQKRQQGGGGQGGGGQGGGGQGGGGHGGGH